MAGSSGFFFFSSRRRHTRLQGDWSSDVCSSDLKLQAAVAPERIIGAVVYSANEVVEPGVIRNFVPGRNMLVVGEPNDSFSRRGEQLRNTLESSGMSSPPAADIRQSVWSKLTQNLGNSTLFPLTEA